MKMPTDDMEGQITKPCTQNWKTRSSLKSNKNGLHTMQMRPMS